MYDLQRRVNGVTLAGLYTVHTTDTSLHGEQL